MKVLVSMGGGSLLNIVGAAHFARLAVGDIVLALAQTPSPRYEVMELIDPNEDADEMWRRQQGLGPSIIVRGPGVVDDLVPRGIFAATPRVTLLIEGLYYVEGPAVYSARSDSPTF
jgi:hypothetical protein